MSIKPMWKASKFPTPTWSLLIQRGYAPALSEGQRREILRKVYKECNYKVTLFRVLYQASKRKQITESIKANLEADREWLRSVSQ